MPIARFVAHFTLISVVLCLLAIAATLTLAKTQAGGSALVYAEYNGGPGSTLQLISVSAFPNTPVWQETLFSNGTRYFVESPDCSPDGQRIVFSSNHLGSVGGYSIPDALEGYHIFILDLETRFTEALTAQSNSYNYAPAWSPDASTILFTHSDDSVQRPNLYTIDMATQEITRLNNDSARYRGLDWSPDGNQIIYAALFPEQGINNSQLYVMDLAEGTSTRLTLNDETDFNDPDWSPDGSQIVLSVFTEIGGSFYPSGIYTMNVDGSNLTQLTTLRGFSPTFSPDGQLIAFTARVNDSDQFDIYVMNADGSNIRQITNTPYYDESIPCWLP